jgi:SAM-dependent methyltransferase
MPDPGRNVRNVLDGDVARQWIDRWDRQQEDDMPDREDRFTVLIDAVEEGTKGAEGAEGDGPLILDIGCGPGSLATRLLDRIPAATVIGIDADPVTLALGRAAHRDRPNLTFLDLDLRTPGWPAALGLGDRKADAAVSTTALHWLPEPDLRAFYKELTTALRPGGLLLNGDHLLLDPVDYPVLADLDRALGDREEMRRFPNGHTESWSGWWEAAAADPVLAPFSAERHKRRVDSNHHSGSESIRLATHTRALEAAGFTEIGTLWQRGDNRLLCAVLPKA